MSFLGKYWENNDRAVLDCTLPALIMLPNGKLGLGGKQNIVFISIQKSQTKCSASQSNSLSLMWTSERHFERLKLFAQFCSVWLSSIFHDLGKWFLCVVLLMQHFICPSELIILCGNIIKAGSGKDWGEAILGSEVHPIPRKAWSCKSLNQAQVLHS